MGDGFSQMERYPTSQAVTLQTAPLPLMVGLRDFLWAQASQVLNSYGSALSAYGLMFLGAHFVWAFSLMFLFSGRGYWQELIESIVWAHNKLKVAPAIQPRALSITQGRAVGLAHYLLGGIATTWASSFHARLLTLG
jgi:photosystem I P700 chlorophyll a apoprotein A1